jgi:glycosyltransferase involved in cell wall biosynthesis
MKSQMLRVAVINTHPIQHFAPLWREIGAQNRVELRVFYCSDWGAAEYHDQEFGETFKWDVDLLSGYDSQFLKLWKRPEKLGFWETNNSDVEDALRSFNPDVVVLFGYNHLTTWRALLWARLRGVRTLVFCDSELKHVRSAWRSAIKEVVVRSFLALVDGGLPIGDCNADYLRHYGLPHDRLYWSAYPVDGRRLLDSVPNVTATRALIRGKYQIDGADFVFASIGKYIRRKRHQDVVHAWMRLPQALRARSAILLIGEGPERHQLKQLAVRANGRVVLTGFVNQSSIASYYAACDALVVASELDAHPLVVTEALFFGLPVIASDAIGCIGPNDTLREGETGLIYRCGDVPALSAALQQVMLDEALRQRLSAGAREIAPGQDAQNVAAKFVEAFQQVFRLPPEKSLRRFQRATRTRSDLGSSHGSVPL